MGHPKGERPSTPRRLSLLGIDGSGKSTVIRQLIRLSSRYKNKYAAVSCTNFHDTPNVPLADFSRAFDAISQLADTLGLSELKYISLYLKMTLFGPIERFLIDSYRPLNLVTERNAIIDSLVYGGFYAGMKAPPLHKEELGQPIREAVEKNTPLSFDAVLHWLELENIRLNRSIDLWQLPDYMRRFYQKPLEELIGDLGLLFRTRLPDIVIYLDIDPEIAARRLSLREKQKELHEKSSGLAKLRDGYIKTLARLEGHYGSGNRKDKHAPFPPVTFTTIFTGSKGKEELLEEIMGEILRV
jgi:shikimate kinase